jgi:hypothetical protein
MSNSINIPKSLFSGTSLTWTDDYDDFSAVDFDVSYFIANREATHEVEGTADGTKFIFDPDTSTWVAGIHQWQITATHKSNSRKYVVATGELKIKALLDGTTGLDSRTVQEKLLDQINDWLIANVTDQEQKITYREMEVWNYDREGLYQLREKLMRELDMIRQAKKRKNGKQMAQVKWRMQ